MTRRTLEGIANKLSEKGVLISFFIERKYITEILLMITSLHFVKLFNCQRSLIRKGCYF